MSIHLDRVSTCPCCILFIMSKQELDSHIHLERFDCISMVMMFKGEHCLFICGFMTRERNGYG